MKPEYDPLDDLDHMERQASTWSLPLIFIGAGIAFSAIILSCS